MPIAIHLGTQSPALCVYRKKTVSVDAVACTLSVLYIRTCAVVCVRTSSCLKSLKSFLYCQGLNSEV